MRECLLAGLLAGAVHPSAYAQDVGTPPVELPPPEAPIEESDDPEDYGDEREIVVTGQRQRGTVLGDIEPEIQLDSRDIRAYGAGSITELLDALAPQTGSGRGREGGRPIVLLNGRRISGFSEIRDLPPEAIERVDILPEEVALKYGYRADQRVVNFVLRPRFRAVTGEVETGIATAGGRGSYEADLNVLRIDDKGRWNLVFEYQHQAPLLESQRDLIQSASERPFDLLGNIGAVTPGAEIDPALSALAGEPVTSAGVPASASLTAPTLGEFAAAANAANVTDLSRYRTLLPETHQFSIAGTINRTIFNDVSATFNARFEENASRALFGLPSATFILPAGSPYSPFASDVALYRYFDGPRPLTRESETQTGHIGIALNGDIAPWRWSFTGNYDRVGTMTATDRGPNLEDFQAALAEGSPQFNPFAPIVALNLRDTTRTINQSANGELVVNGPLLTLPAGPVSASFRAGAETRDFHSETDRSGVELIRDLSRDRLNAQANIDVPIASRSDDVLAAIGDLSLNANAEVEHFSDFGTLRTYGGGLNWSPIEEVRLLASFTDEEGAPTIQQLGNPLSITPNVRVFDFTRGETVDVTATEGGNPGLVADNRRVFKLGLNVRPLEETDLSIRADYNRSRTRNLIASFPTATPEIEDAFPKRFERDAQNRLFGIDTRPVNFARADREELRWGINYSKPISSSGGGGGRGGWRARMAEAEGAQGTPPSAPGAAVPPAPAGAPPATGAVPPGEPETEGRPQGRRGARAGGRGPGGEGQGPGGGGRGFGGRGFGGGGQGQGGRLQLALYHTWHIKNEILIREGVPVLDLLGGSATGSRGGQPRHEVEFQAGLFKDGYGARLNADWQSGTFVRGGLDGDGGSASDLRFSSLATVNLRLFADLGQQRALVRKHRWLRGTRVSLRVDNLFDSRIQVRDDTGATPLGYQPDYLDPLGRSVRIEVRKLFF